MNGIDNGHELDKLDVKRIKNADAVCLDFDLARGLSQLRAIRKAENTSDGYEQSFAIATDARVELHKGYSDYSRDYPNVTAFEHISSCKYYPEWQTIASLLHEGDVVRVEWVSYEPGNKNGGYAGNAVCALPDYLNQPLYQDNVTIVILRKGEAKYTFNFRTSFCPANSAQTIKWDGRRW